MNTSENFHLLSDVLLDDERIVSADEREFLADLLRQSENNPDQANPQLTQAIARIAGEIVVQRASGLLGNSILHRLSQQSLHTSKQSDLLSKHSGSYAPGGPPKPPSPVPPTPGPKMYTSADRELIQSSQRPIFSLPPKPPAPVPPTPGPGGGLQMRRKMTAPKGILDPDQISEFASPRCIQLEEFLAPAELNDLFSYALANQEHFIASEVISSSAPNVSSTDFHYRRSRVLMDLGPFQETVLNRLCSALPRVLPKLGIEPFQIESMEAQITASGDGDFFHWHSDNAENEVARRYVTFVYFFHHEPRAFEGGELRIKSSTWKNYSQGHDNYYTVVPRQNQIVLFDSSLMHEITPIKCPSGKFADSRFTVNGWFLR